MEIQRRAAEAWTDFAAGRRTEALEEMRAAVEREAATEKNAITPVPSPAGELLGEMLLASGAPVLALEAFQATLIHEPHRFRSLSGAFQAAKAAGDTVTARQYSAELRRPPTR